MKWLFLLIAAPAAAQIFPAEVKDPATSDNLQFLYEQVQKAVNGGLSGSYIPTGAPFGGEVTGLYSNLTIPSLAASKLTGALPAISGAALTGVIVSTAAAQSISGAVVVTSSVTASTFFGDGSHLTGLSGMINKKAAFGTLTILGRMEVLNVLR